MLESNSSIAYMSRFNKQHCIFKYAETWTHNARAAAVVNVIADRMGCTTQDQISFYIEADSKIFRLA
nr:hypothetical protein [Tanacetum cinerariifolium]